MTKQAAKTWLSNNAVNLVITVLMAFTGFSVREYVQLTKQMYDKLIEKQDDHNLLINDLNTNYQIDHKEIENHQKAINDIVSVNDDQEAILQRHETEILTLKLK